MEYYLYIVSVWKQWNLIRRQEKANIDLIKKMVFMNTTDISGSIWLIFPTKSSDWLTIVSWKSP